MADKKQLRQHQTEAVASIIASWRNGETPYAMLPPGSGKSLTLAELSRLARKKGGRVLQICPWNKLTVQNFLETESHLDNAFDCGIIDAKLGRFDIDKPVVIGTITSVYTRFLQLGKFDLLLIDEGHSVSCDPDSMYIKVINHLMEKNPKLLIAGVSGTPYRMGQGWIHEPDKNGNPSIFTNMAYQAEIKGLIEKGFLSPLVTLNVGKKIDTSRLRMKGRDFDQEEAALRFDDILPESIRHTKEQIKANDIKSMIIFVSNVKSAHDVEAEYGEGCKVLTGSTSTRERNKILDWLETDSNNVRVVVTPNILCEGYDYPKLDCVCLMRATASLRLYVQSITRAIRAHSEKECGYVLDFGGNVDRHGCILDIDPKKIVSTGAEAPKKECLARLESDIEKEINGEIFIGLKGDPCGYANPISAKSCVFCEARFMSTPDGKYKMVTKGEAMELAKSKNWFDVAYYHFTNKDHFVTIECFGHGGKKIANKIINFNGDFMQSSVALGTLKSICKNDQVYERACILDNKGVCEFFLSNPTALKRMAKVKAVPSSKNPKYKDILAFEFIDEPDYQFVEVSKKERIIPVQAFINQLVDIGLDEDDALEVGQITDENKRHDTLEYYEKIMDKVKKW
ncbi:MAG: DEAD/DEAH box helicase family protein [Methyloglobulus sp.]|nr:DEAD/DEAH box helicase family protein [Methyloglobulus sp.]